MRPGLLWKWHQSNQRREKRNKAECFTGTLTEIKCGIINYAQKHFSERWFNQKPFTAAVTKANMSFWGFSSFLPHYGLKFLVFCCLFVYEFPQMVEASGDHTEPRSVWGSTVLKVWLFFSPHISVWTVIIIIILLLVGKDRPDPKALLQYNNFWSFLLSYCRVGWMDWSNSSFKCWFMRRTRKLH